MDFPLLNYLYEQRTEITHTLQDFIRSVASRGRIGFGSDSERINQSLRMSLANVDQKMMNETRH